MYVLVIAKILYVSTYMVNNFAAISMDNIETTIYLFIYLFTVIYIAHFP